jgi:hypothetical protein
MFIFVVLILGGLQSIIRHKLTNKKELSCLREEGEQSTQEGNLLLLLLPYLFLLSLPIFKPLPENLCLLLQTIQFLLQLSCLSLSNRKGCFSLSFIQLQYFHS